MDAIDEIEALKKELQFYKTRSDLAIERSNDGFWDWNLVEGTLYNSSQWFEIVGWSEKGLPKGLERFVKVVHPDDLERVEKTLNEYLQGKIEQYHVEFAIICEDGSVRYLLDRGSAVFDEYSKPLRMVGFCTDITNDKLKDIMILRQNKMELEKALFKADEASRAKTQFLANMSHEIRTPMNAIIGFSELLERSDLTKQQQEYLSTIKGSSKTLLTLINDILDLSKIEVGKINLHYNVVDVVAMFEDLNRIFLLESEKKDISLELNIQKELPLGLYFDEVRLRQIFLNIISNAIKFTNQGFVKIELSFHSVRAKTIELEIKVRDSGIGIKKTQQAQVFNLFEQQDGQDTRKYGGTGLGLSISRNLAQMMGGDIRVESKDGEGSTFIVNFEGVGIEENIESKTLEISRVRFKKAKLLVVDDVETNIQLIESLFQKSSIEVISAKNGQEAYDIAKVVHPDIILMDIRMPIMDGFESTTLIKRDVQTKEIPIIALTASVVFKDKAHYIDRGFDGFLEKPLDINTLMEQLKKYLNYDYIENKPAKLEMILSEQALEKLEAFIVTLEEKRNDEYAEILNQNSFESYVIWTQKLLECSHDYDNNYMVLYATQILDAIEAFDIEKFRGEIQRFPTVIKELKKKL